MAQTRITRRGLTENLRPVGRTTAAPMGDVQAGLLGASGLWRGVPSRFTRVDRIDPLGTTYRSPEATEIIHGGGMGSDWHGRDWEEYCILLLQMRYAANSPHSLQLVPDRHQGDLGLEAFSLDGAAYQCYAAQEPLSVDDCFARQRDKLTTDLGKLKSNATTIAAMLGGVLLNRYVFLVHRHDSRFLITHATKKATEVVQWGLPYIDPAFRIVIETDDAYAFERRTIHAIPTPLVEVPDIEPPQQQAWVASNLGLQAKAVEKLEKVHKSATTVENVVESLTLQYLKGENALERLRAVVPDAHRSIIAATSQREQLLALEYPPGVNDNPGKMAEIARNFSQSLLSEFPILNSATADLLAWSAVADWLMRCPLDFEDAS